MSGITHTPGPWQHEWHFIVAPDRSGWHPDIYIAEIAGEDSDGRIAPPEEQAANGRLLAAAPDLLSACRLVVDRWEHGDLAEAARACDAAVALAVESEPFVLDGDAPAVPYSVLLLYPDDANDSGVETYYAFVNAPCPATAVDAAQRQASAAQQAGGIEPEAFVPLLVTRGHHYGEALYIR